MRVWGLLFVVLLACTSVPGSGPAPASLRERLATETHLFVAASDSAGAITARRKTDTGWNDQRVALALDSGELVASAARDGNLMLSMFELGFRPVTIPASVLGHEAELTNLHVRLVAPTAATAIWSGDDRASATATLDLQLSWWLGVDGVGLPLGMPRLPPVALTLTLSDDGSGAAAELGVTAAGALWSWAQLVELSDFGLSLVARTPER